ncbi:unnamed protein product [Brachionus calyciflorus]|uniref:Uncharacterized protein n=1 Tax=Brachionus calyciflorus TaxID=104777 RepID=A0A813PJY7_9BILA|nr:unnamed protein product [Brachionus calyciflorus]
MIFENIEIPICSEQIIIKLLNKLCDPIVDKTCMDLMKDIENLEIRLKKEDLWIFSFDGHLNNIKSNINIRNFNESCSLLKLILGEIRAIDISEIQRLIKSNQDDLNCLRGKSIYLLLGITGAGKSTTLHYLAGSKMELGDLNGKTCVKPLEGNNTNLKNVTTSSNIKSETKKIFPVELKYSLMKEENDNDDDLCQKKIIICDTPGFGDTNGIEVNISNGILLKQTISLCKGVKPLIVFNMDLGPRKQLLKDLAIPLLEMIPNEKILETNATYLITKFENKKNVLSCFEKMKNDIEDMEEYLNDNASKFLINDLVKKSKDDKVIFIDPLENNPNKVLKKIIFDNNSFIENVDRYFRIGLNDMENRKLSDQIKKTTDLIKISIKNNEFDLAKFKLRELKFLVDIKPVNFLNDDFEKFLQLEILNFTFKDSKFERCLTNNQTISEPDLNECLDLFISSIELDNFIQEINKAEISYVKINFFDKLKCELNQLIEKISNLIKFDFFIIPLKNFKIINNYFNEKKIHFNDKDIIENLHSKYGKCFTEIIQNLREFYSNCENSSKFISIKTIISDLNEIDDGKKADLDTIEQEVISCLKKNYLVKSKSYESLTAENCISEFNNLYQIEQFFNSEIKSIQSNEYLTSLFFNIIKKCHCDFLNGIKNFAQNLQNQILSLFEQGDFSFQNLYEVLKLSKKLFDALGLNDDDILIQKLEHKIKEILRKINYEINESENGPSIVKLLSLLVKLNELEWFITKEENAKHFDSIEKNIVIYIKTKILTKLNHLKLDLDEDKLKKNYDVYVSLSKYKPLLDSKHKFPFNNELNNLIEITFEDFKSKFISLLFIDEKADFEKFDSQLELIKNWFKIVNDSFDNELAQILFEQHDLENIKTRLESIIKSRIQSIESSLCDFESFMKSNFDFKEENALDKKAIKYSNLLEQIIDIKLKYKNCYYFCNHDLIQSCLDLLKSKFDDLSIGLNESEQSETFNLDYVKMLSASKIFKNFDSLFIKLEDSERNFTSLCSHYEESYKLNKRSVNDLCLSFIERNNYSSLDVKMKLFIKEYPIDQVHLVQINKNLQESLNLLVLGIFEKIKKLSFENDSNLRNIENNLISFKDAKEFFQDSITENHYLKYNQSKDILKHFISDLISEIDQLLKNYDLNEANNKRNLLKKILKIVEKFEDTELTKIIQNKLSNNQLNENEIVDFYSFDDLIRFNLKEKYKFFINQNEFANLKPILDQKIVNFFEIETNRIKSSESNWSKSNEFYEECKEKAEKYLPSELYTTKISSILDQLKIELDLKHLNEELNQINLNDKSNCEKLFSFYQDYIKKNNKINSDRIKRFVLDYVAENEAKAEIEFIDKNYSKFIYLYFTSFIIIHQTFSSLFSELENFLKEKYQPKLEEFSAGISQKFLESNSLEKESINELSNSYKMFYDLIQMEPKLLTGKIFHDFNKIKEYLNLKNLEIKNLENRLNDDLASLKIEYFENCILWTQLFDSLKNIDSFIEYEEKDKTLKLISNKIQSKLIDLKYLDLNLGLSTEIKSNDVFYLIHNEYEKLFDSMNKQIGFIKEINEFLQRYNFNLDSNLKDFINDLNNKMEQIQKDSLNNLELILNNDELNIQSLNNFINGYFGLKFFNSKFGNDYKDWDQIFTSIIESKINDILEKFHFDSIENLAKLCILIKEYSNKLILFKKFVDTKLDQIFDAYILIKLNFNDIKNLVSIFKKLTIGQSILKEHKIFNNFKFDSNDSNSIVNITDIQSEDLERVKKYLKIIFTESNSTIEENAIEREFNELIENQLDGKILLNAFNSKSPIFQLKSYLFDLLKSNKNFQIVKSFIYENENELCETIKELLDDYLTERDLLSSLIDSCNQISLAKLGSLIIKNEYPIPLTYYKLSKNTNELEIRIKFDLLNEFLCLSSNPIALITKTKRCVRSDNLSLIPIIFPGAVIFKTKSISQYFFNIDVILKDPDWTILDINGDSLSDKNYICYNLMKSFSAYSSVHIINCEIEDFNSNGEPGEELKSILKWSHHLKEKSFFVIVIRDTKLSNELFNLIDQRLKELYFNNLIRLMVVEKFQSYESSNLSNSQTRSLVKLNQDFDLIFKKISRSSYSLNDIICFYQSLKFNDRFVNNSTSKLDIELQFYDENIKKFSLFQDLVIQNDFYKIRIFERCLENSNNSNIKSLIREKSELLEEFSRLDSEIKAKNLKLSINNDLTNNYNIIQNKIRNIDFKIEQMNLYLNKFWSELYTNYGKFSNKSELYEKYLNCIQYGYSINLFRNDISDLKCDFLLNFFKYLSLLDKTNKKIVVVSIIGDGKSAKTSLLKSLFGANFAQNQSTKGIEMSFVSYKDKTIILLDTESLNNINTDSNRFLDSQLMSIIFLISHIVLINSANELSSRIELLLRVSLTKISSVFDNKFKPFLYFINRDQINLQNKELIIKSQLFKLKERLLEYTINLGQIDVCLLPSSIYEDLDKLTAKKIVRLNNKFSEDLIDLRKKILQKIESIEQSYLYLTYYEDFYSKMFFYSNLIKNINFH